MKRFALLGLTVILSILLGGCFSFQKFGELPSAKNVDLNNAMGTWYVVGYMPTAFDKNAHNATFGFSRNRDGSIDVKYEYNSGMVDGPLKSHDLKAIVKEIETNATWSIRFFWPIRSDYKVIFVDPDNSVMVLGHPSRKNIYILSREQTLTDKEYQWLLDFVASRGFDTSYLQRVSQS